jgi:hypothetical protein
VNNKERRNGLENWRSIVDELGVALEDTTMVDTPSGGMHLWYRAASHGITSGNAALAPGIDVKAAGGYVVAPPSIIAGKPYAFRDGHGFDRLADLPPALADLLANPQSERRRDRDTPQPESVILEGQRNATLASLAGTMRRRAMSEAAILAALLEDNAQRCRPPLDQDEVRRIARSVARYEPGPDSAGSSTVSESDGAVFVGQRLRVTALSDLASLQFERPTAVVSGYVYVNAIADLSAQPKTGKTTLLLAAAGAVCRGEAFLGRAVLKGPVIYLTEENSPTFLEAARRVHVADAPGLDVVLRRDAWGLSWEEVCAELSVICAQKGVVLVIIDTLSDWAGMRGEEENTAGAALQVIEPLRRLSQLPNLAVITARHERKSGGELGEAARGSSQFTGAVDVVVALRKGTLRNQRHLMAVGRFDDIPGDLVIEFDDGRYVSLGEPQESDREMLRRAAAWQALPKTRAEAVSVADVAEAIGASDDTARRVLDELVSSGRAQKERGVAAGAHATAFGYWRDEDL